MSTNTKQAKYKNYEIRKPILYRYTCQTCKNEVDWQPAELVCCDTEALTPDKTYTFDIGKEMSEKLHNRLSKSLDKAEKLALKNEVYKIYNLVKRDDNGKVASVGVCPHCESKQLWSKTLMGIGGYRTIFAFLLVTAVVSIISGVVILSDGGSFFKILIFSVSTVLFLIFLGMLLRILLIFASLKRQGRNGNFVEVNFNRQLDNEELFVEFSNDVGFSGNSLS